MSSSHVDTGKSAENWAQVSSDRFMDMANYLRSLPEDAWKGPTACTDWNVYDLAGHIVGEAVWFANLARGVVANEEPLPLNIYDEMKTWPKERIADRIEESGCDILQTILAATPYQLQQDVDMGWVTLPLWRATFVSALEATLHNWDAHAIYEPDTTIPKDRAVTLAPELIEYAVWFVHHRYLPMTTGTYLLGVSDGIGNVSVDVSNSNVVLINGKLDNPVAELNLTADQLVRLLTGRLDLGAESGRDKVAIEGNRDRAIGLNKLFGGIANER